MANGAAGVETSEWGFYCIGFDELRPGVTDPKARLHDMDLAGVWASLCFGSIVWGFAGTRLSKMSDQDVGLASLKAYNDWMIEEWCGVAPDRYIPCQLPWMTDPETAAAEIRRNAERGYRAVSFSENPEGLGFPNIYDRYWDPFFAACQETETVVNLHVGSSGNTRHPSTSSPSDVSVALFPVSGLEALIDWIYAGVPRALPATEDRPFRGRRVLGADGSRAAAPGLRPRRGPRLATGQPAARGAGPAQLLLLLDRGPLGVPVARPDRRGQRHGRDRLPPLRHHLAGMPRDGPQAAARRWSRR